jgi:hypothetical protein
MINGSANMIYNPKIAGALWDFVKYLHLYHSVDATPLLKLWAIDKKIDIDSVDTDWDIPEAKTSFKDSLLASVHIANENQIDRDILLELQSIFFEIFKNTDPDNTYGGAVDLANNALKYVRILEDRISELTRNILPTQL